jgi:hypothetical protein
VRESRDEDLDPRGGRIQVSQAGQLADHRFIVLGRVPGKAVEDVVVDADACELPKLQGQNVLGAGDALVH